MLGRANKIRGDLYALAGRWTEAHACYAEAVTLARGVVDPLWEAAATERQLMTTVLLAWLPHMPEAPAAHSAAPARVDLTTLGTRPVSQEVAAQAVASAREVPERYKALVELYSRLVPPHTSLASLDALPSVIFIEASLRLARLELVVLRHSGWSPRALAELVEGEHAVASTVVPRSMKRLSASAGNASGLVKADVSDALSHAFSPLLANLPVPQRLGYLNAIASLYGTLGFLRKRAAAVREIVGVAADALRRARAASHGGHAAEIVSSAPAVEGNDALVLLLEQVCDAYGVDLVSRIHADDRANADKRISIIGGPGARRATAAAAGSEASDALADARCFGWPTLQVAVLRDSITACEALPDYSSALRFTISALREAAAVMPPLDQLQLSQAIPAIFAHAARRGTAFALDYWGPLDLLVSLEAAPVPTDRVPIERASAGADAPRGPFIYSSANLKRTSATMVSAASV